MKLLVSAAYFAPVEYFCAAAGFGEVVVEAHERYRKQSYRSRCEILGANGVLPLVVPVQRVHGSPPPIRDVRIDYATPWQRQHWRSLRSAYGSSPFYMHYADELAPFFFRREGFLLDLNLSVTRLLLGLVGLCPEVSLTDSYAPSYADALDFRRCVSPKRSRREERGAFSAAEYYQVFSPRFGFVPNLSILDLLFNEGPSALETLRRSACGGLG
ncbi:MAG: WbqC family protein [Prevotellaceae bacterium]|nr:WbqC family protein [Prevotellaceae bacterium]